VSSEYITSDMSHEVNMTRPRSEEIDVSLSMKMPYHCLLRNIHRLAVAEHRRGTHRDSFPID
jgi:hypothetical protein